MADNLKPVVIAPVSGSDPTGEDAGGPTWWGQYTQSLRDLGTLSPSALQELKRVTEAVAARLPDTKVAGARMVGAVVGAVQSGKTGVLAGIAAHALDRGYRVILVLAGQKDDLRMQTARRLKRDLLCKGDRVYRWQNGVWAASEPPEYDHPKGKGAHGPKAKCWSPHYKDDINKDDAFSMSLIDRVRKGDSALLVVKKNAKVLERLHSSLARLRRVYGEAHVPMLILDDECDEASVGDPEVGRPTSESIKALLMNADKQPVAYVGITATIAANITQDPNDALFPGDFIEVLKYAASADTQLSFAESNPLLRYTGGYSFYEMLEEHEHKNWLISTSISDEERVGEPGYRAALEEAIIAFFVSAGMRWAMFKAATIAGSARPPIHTMMLHTESRISDHWSLAKEVVALIHGKGGTSIGPEMYLERIDPSARISTSEIEIWLALEEDRWRKWHESFCLSRIAVEAVMPGVASRTMPTWAETAEQLKKALPFLKLRVLNSDDASNEPPLSFGSDGGLSPYDCFSMIIGGDRLSRGLTIEGLSIAYFTRHVSGLQAEDTAVQRERWFGYRGTHLEYCRVFLHPDTAREYRQFYQHESDLRRQFCWALYEGRTPRETAFRLLCLPVSRPTAKSTSRPQTRISISGMNVFVNRVQMGRSTAETQCSEINEGHAKNWWTRISSSGEERLSPKGASLAWILRDVPTEDAIKLLEGFVYTFHNPDPARHISVVLREVHRTVSLSMPSSVGLSSESCPYLAAAYLRLWALAHSAPSKLGGLVVRGEDGVSPWETVAAPRFNVAFRFGLKEVSHGDPFSGAKLLNRAIDSDGYVRGRWGGHGAVADNFGDEWIDGPPPDDDETAPRPCGWPGLIVIHVAHKDAKGVGDEGSTYERHRPFVGVRIPEGGPTFEAVIVTPGLGG